jgi:hypothetical protein
MPHVGAIQITNYGFTDVTLKSTVTNGDDETVSIVERGFCWAALVPEPMNDTLKCNEGANGVFEGTIEGLVAQRQYYARAYAKSNFNKIQYSNDTSFFTKTDVPTVRTEKVSNVQNGNANVKGIVVDEGISPIINAGICWSPTNSTPTFADSVLYLPVGAGGVFSGTLTNLKGGVTYYVRAFAANTNGTSFGAETEAFTAPSVFTADSHPFPGTPRLPNSTAYFAINDMLYLLGGDIGPNYTDELRAYSISDSGWKQFKSFMGGPAKWQTGVRYGEGAFVYGGYDENGIAMPKPGLFYYNPKRNEWEKRSLGADTLYLPAGCAYQSSLLYIGGKRDTVKQDVWSYMVVVDLWDKKPDFPVKQYGGIAVALDGAIYVGLGRDDTDECNGSLWVTTDGAETWTLKTECTIYENGILAGVASLPLHRIYVIDEDYYILEYNPADDVWTKKSRLPSEFQGVHCMYEYEGKIYIGLGSANSLVIYDPLWDN